MPQVQYDPIAGILAKARTPNTVRADAWDAFHDARDADDLAERLRGLSLDDAVKADLWDLKSTGTDRRTPAAAEDFNPRGRRAEGSTFGEKIRNAAAMIGDVAIGAGKGAVGTVANTVELAANAGVIPGMARGAVFDPAMRHPGFTRAEELTRAENTAQMVGKGLETVAEFAVPTGQAVNAIPRAARAGQKFQQVMAAAKDIPISVSAPTNVAMRIEQLAGRGGSMPKPVRDWLKRVMDPSKGPEVTYEEAKDFATNIGQLSVDETRRLTPSMRREINELRVTLNKSIADAAGRAGKGREFADAMKEYAQAMRLKKTLADVGEGARQALPIAGAGAAGGWLVNRLIGK